MNNFEYFGLKKQIILKKLKLSTNFVHFKQSIIPGSDWFNEEWFFAMSIDGILQQETSDVLERAISAASSERLSQRVTGEFCNEQQWFLATSNLCNE